MFRLATTLLLLLVIQAALPVRGGPAGAQQPPVAPGDFYWQLVPSGVAADMRVEMAFALLIDAGAVVRAAGVEGSLHYGDGEVAQFAQQVGRGESQLLLAAAGFADPGKDMRLTRTCRFWTPLGVDGDAERMTVGEALGQELARVLGELGLDAAPCEFAEDSRRADVVVWQFGQSLEITGSGSTFDGDSFLMPNVELPGAVPGGTGGSLTPPGTGTGGLLPSSRQ